jgi:hypothetical protein
LCAPKASRREPRREAERTLVMWLQVAVAEAGAKVPVTAHHYKRGPFAKMTAEVLRLVRAPESAEGLAVELINHLERERAAQRREQSSCDPDSHVLPNDGG